jgi:hypothetical protein
LHGTCSLAFFFLLIDRLTASRSQNLAAASLECDLIVLGWGLCTFKLASPPSTPSIKPIDADEDDKKKATRL